MSSNLLKRGYTCLQDETPRIIDSASRAIPVNPKATVKRMEPEAADENGFASGLSADILEALTGEDAPEGDSEEGIFPQEAAQDQGPDPEELRRQALAEIEEMKAAAAEELEAEKQRVLKEARLQGYQEGLDTGRLEADSLRVAVEKEKKELEAQYEAMVAELEPGLIEVLTGVYEHVFKVELSGYRDLILFLISGALSRIEGGKDLIVHVSKEDYPYVSMQKKQILETVPGNATVEIIEDITLAKNDAMIETDGGIFDCSLGTQLEELSRKIRLLSYDGNSGDNG